VSSNFSQSSEYGFGYTLQWATDFIFISAYLWPLNAISKPQYVLILHLCFYLIDCSPKVYADLVGCLLSSPKAKAIVILMQSSSEKEFRSKSVLYRLVTECINRIRTATSSDKGSGTNPFLALPTLMRAAVHIGRFSCDCNVRCGDEDTLDRLWQEVIGLHDNVARSANPLPHLVLGTLEALMWLTQCITGPNNDDIDDEGYQWLAVQDRVLRAIPLLQLSDSSVLAITLTNRIMERAKQPEGFSRTQGEAGKASEGDFSVRHHSKASLKLLLSAGEFLVHCYPNTETVIQLDSIWTFIAQFTVRPSGDAATADSDDKVPPSPTAAPSDSSSPSYFLDLADLTGPASPSLLSKKSVNTHTPERAVHTFLRRSFLQALDGGSAHAVPAVPVRQNRNKAQENAATQLLSQHALWHLAEHVRTTPTTATATATHTSISSLTTILNSV
jgi:hypothetical protein